MLTISAGLGSKVSTCEADERSSLTARVAVNRVWQNIFGVGLVEPAEDFGTRADTPEHRELLDSLAVDFMAHGWSQKHLLSTILSSVTYQQSSHVASELLSHDPRNRILARQSRYRADAEVVRDITVTVSGLIHHKLGGPSDLKQRGLLNDTLLIWGGEFGRTLTPV